MSDYSSTPRRLEAARALRAYLPELLSNERESARFDQAVRELLLLAEDAPDTAADQFSRILDGHPAIQAWTELVLADNQLRPPDIQAWEERTVGGVGSPLPVPARKFVCPVDSLFVRYERTSGQDTGDCPDHHVRLVPA